MSEPDNGLAAMVLAAGFSRRFGSENKLHAMLESGVSVVSRVMENVAVASFKRKIVVYAADDSKLISLARKNSFDSVVNMNAEQGIGSSIACGVSSLSSISVSGVAIFLGDMPFIKIQTVAELAARFAQDESRIVRPVCEGREGHPVFFPANFFGELASLDGDRGASSILKQNRSRLCLVNSVDDGVLRDIDTPSDLHRLSSQMIE